jgi:polyisoprenoid-binding protein YceI
MRINLAIMRNFICGVIAAMACQFAGAQAADIDSAHSSITVKVEKTGLFSAFAHNHTIQAPLATGHLDTQKRIVSLTLNTKDMKVIDEGVKESERAEIEQTMKSEKVLDVQKFPEIRFASTSITPQDGGRYQVTGDLTLHGTTHAIEFPIAESKGRYTGSVKLKQSEFGIAPVSIAGGAVKVKDGIEIVFEIVAAK